MYLDPFPCIIPKKFNRHFFFRRCCQWVSLPFAMTNDAVSPLTTNATEVWIKDVDPVYSGFYIDCYLVLIFGGIPWQVRLLTWARLHTDSWGLTSTATSYG